MEGDAGTQPKQRPQGGRIDGGPGGVGQKKQVAKHTAKSQAQRQHVAAEGQHEPVGRPPPNQQGYRRQHETDDNLGAVADGVDESRFEVGILPVEPHIYLVKAHAALGAQ